MTAEIVALEMQDRTQFAALLGAEVPVNWPPEMLRDALPWFAEQLTTKTGMLGWLGWYALCHRSGEIPLLVGSGGFLGTPENGVAEVGYSVLPQYQGQGYGTEMVGGLTDWALSQPDVQRLAAETGEANLASRRLLEKLGFTAVRDGRETGDVRFERTKEPQEEKAPGR